MTRACDEVKQGGKYPYEELYIYRLFILLLKSGFGYANA